MTLTQFENGYWYQFELKVFAESIGIPSANKLRKDELEKAIVTFLNSEEYKNPPGETYQGRVSETMRKD